MRRFIIFSLVVICLSVFVVPAIAAESQQYFAKEDFITWDREKVGQDAVGTLYGKFPFNRSTASPDFIIKEVGWMTLNPGDSVGLHKHTTNEDAFVIISGEGVFTDSDGKEFKLKPGDVTIARQGQSHAIKNTGGEPLVFLVVIAGTF